MANEVTVRVSLQIKKDALYHTSIPTGYSDDMSVAKAPSPGGLTIPVYGKIIPLTEIDTPGYCWMQNLDETNYVEYGVYDAQTDVFYPFGELLPGGKPQLVYLSRNFREEYVGTGTGTTSEGNHLYMKADTADCNVVIYAFER